MAAAMSSPELLGNGISATSDHGKSIGRKRGTARAHLGLQPGRRLDGDDGRRAQQPTGVPASSAWFSGEQRARRSKGRRWTASLPRLEPRQRRARSGDTASEHLPRSGGTRAPRRQNEQIRRRRWLIYGKDEGGKNTATLIEHPRAEIVPNPVNPGLDSVLARDESGSATIRRWKTRLTAGSRPSAKQKREEGAAMVSWAGPRGTGVEGKAAAAQLRGPGASAGEQADPTGLQAAR
jgi:hypothetical protein